jgi:hypothetical protein
MSKAVAAAEYETVRGGGKGGWALRLRDRAVDFFLSNGEPEKVLGSGSMVRDG